MFATRFHPETSEDEITSFVASQFSGAKDIKCKKLKTKFDSYSSFRISISSISFKDSLGVENWPEGIFVKRYYVVPGNTVLVVILVVILLMLALLLKLLLKNILLERNKCCVLQL